MTIKKLTVFISVKVEARESDAFLKPLDWIVLVFEVDGLYLGTVWADILGKDIKDWNGGLETFPGAQSKKSDYCWCFS